MIYNNYYNDDDDNNNYNIYDNIIMILIMIR